jgi:hypothetical protein
MTRGRAAELRRAGDEERRRLRRVAAAGRLARHPRADRPRSRSRCCRCRRPRPRCARACRERSARAAEPLGGQPLPISATAWHDGEPALRLSGASAAVMRGARTLVGDGARGRAWRAARFWARHPRADRRVLRRRAPLWRLSVPSTAPPLELPGRQLIEWGGALRWLRTDADPATARGCAAGRRQRDLFRAATDKRAGAFPPLAARVLELHRRSSASSTRAASSTPAGCIPASERPDPMETHLADWLRGTPEGTRGRVDPAQVRALRLLHGDLPDLPAARRRAGRPARPHLPDEAGARRRAAHARDAAAPRPLPDLPRCETTCPSGVRYGRLVDIGRAVVEQRVPRPQAGAGSR